MWIYSHTDHTLKGYSRLTHEAVHLEKDEVKEVSEEVGTYLLGTYPLQFCAVAPIETMASHALHCPYSQKGDLSTQTRYANRRVGRPPRDRMLRTT